MTRGPRIITQKPRRIFAIGDLHGCPFELDVLLQHLSEREGFSLDDLLVFIGDYVDRGERSKDVLQRLADLRRRVPGTVFLRGNHDDMMLGYLGFGGARGEVYLDNGGVQCLKSYGVNAPYSREESRVRIPPEHIEFLLHTELYAMSGEYLFAHAGINPLRDLNAQTSDDLLWIRNEFVGMRHHLGKTVVFGHTPYQDAVFLPPWKIGIDTGLVYGNKLTCLELPSMRVHQVGSGSQQVVVRQFDSAVPASA